METINWGIIGCGEVTEKKSGPAFNLIENSKLIAVMRRNTKNARDYSKRHKVPLWYDKAEKLLENSEINAVYIATPPDTHAKYSIMAANAGKHVYVEKPMALNTIQCKEMIVAAKRNKVSLFVAYYRRALPYFLKVKELVDSGAIGSVRCVNIKLFKSIPPDLDSSPLPWRFKPEISGGGQFVDLGSHQLDYLDFLFGPIDNDTVRGITANQAGRYPAEDIVTAVFKFKSGIIGTGTWCFSVSHEKRTDMIEIVGNKGLITFSTFSFEPIKLESESTYEEFEYSRPEPIQLTLIQKVVDNLLDIGVCPSTGETAIRTTMVMENILGDYYKKSNWASEK